MSSATRTTAEALESLVIDTIALTHHTQLYHWNVTGPHFAALHDLFEAQYNELSLAGDELAERLRALGHMVNGGLDVLAQRATLPKPVGTGDAMAMVADLQKGHEMLAKAAFALSEAAEEAGDAGTADLAIERGQAHDKTAWMLKAHLG